MFPKRVFILSFHKWQWKQTKTINLSFFNSIVPFLYSIYKCILSSLQHHCKTLALRSEWLFDVISSTDSRLDRVDERTMIYQMAHCVFLYFLAVWPYWILRWDTSLDIQRKEKKKERKNGKKKKRSVKFLGVSVLPICHLLYWTWMCSGWQQTWYCCCGAVMWYCQWEIMVRGAWQHPDAHLKAAIWWLHKHISTIHFLCISVLYVWLIFSDSELQVRRNPNTLRLVCKQASIKHSMTIKYCA